MYDYLNNLKNVEPLNIGLSNQIGIKNMSNNKGELNKILINDDDDSEMVTVSTLDQITQNKKNISLLKIDVEGYEMEVLKGATETIKNVEYIMIELNNNTKRYGSSNLEIEKHLPTLGFTMLFKIWPDIIYRRQ